MKGVDKLVASSHKTAACTHDIISYASTVNAVSRRDVLSILLGDVMFLRVLYYIVNFIMRA